MTPHERYLSTPKEWNEEVTSECCDVELVDDEKGNSVCKYCGQECDEQGVPVKDEPLVMDLNDAIYAQYDRRAA